MRLLRVMRFFEPLGVTIFESLLRRLQSAWCRRILDLIARSVLLEIFLGNHVQLRGTGKFCIAWRFLSRILISRSFLRRVAVSRAMRAEFDQAAHDERGDPYQHKKPHWLEFSWHELRLPNHARFLQATFSTC
jgi:hypothetical protein